MCQFVVARASADFALTAIGLRRRKAKFLKNIYIGGALLRRLALYAAINGWCFCDQALTLAHESVIGFTPIPAASAYSL